MAQLKQNEIIEQGNPFDGIIKGIETLTIKEKELIETNKVLQQSYSNIEKTNDGKQAKELARLTTELTKANKALMDVQKARAILDKNELIASEKLAKIKKIETDTEIKLAREKDRAAATAAKKEAAEKRAEAASKKAAEANNFAADSLKGMSKRLGELRRAYSEMSAAERKSKLGKETLKNIKELDTQVKKLNANQGLFQRFVGQYQNAMRGISAGWLAITGAVAGAIASVKGISDEIYINARLNKQLKASLGGTNEQIKEQTILIKKLSSVYEADYQGTLSAANTLSKNFGITGTESLKLIEEGFAKGANNSGQFLDILREYPTQLKAVGLSAEESIAIITQQVKSGVYSDKGIDTIKEAGIALREMTQSTSDALRAIGLDSADITRRLTSGESSLFEVIKEISVQMGKLPENSKAVGMALADIFKGAGEDAGIGYIKSLGTMSTKLSDIDAYTNDAIDSSNRLAAAWNEFATNVTSESGSLSKVKTYFQNLSASVLEMINNLFRAETEGEREMRLYREKISADEKAKADKKLNESIEREKERLRIEQELNNKAAEDRIKAIEAENKRKAEAAKKAEADRKAYEERRKADETQQLTKSITDKEIAATKENELNKGVTDAFLIELNKRKVGEETLTASYENGEKERIRIQQDAAQRRIDIYLGTINSITQAYDELINDADATIGQFLANVLKGIIESVSSAISASYIKIIASQLESLATLNPAKLASATAALVGIQLLKSTAIRLLTPKPKEVTDVPKFAEGGLVTGPGTGTSDSIDAKLSNGEFVLTADKVAKNPKLISAMHDGKLTDSNASTFIRNQFDDSNIVSQLGKLNSLMENMGFAYENDGKMIIQKSTGEIIKIIR